SQAGVFQNGRFHILLDLQQPITGLTAASGGGVWIAAGHHLFRSSKNGAIRDCGPFNSDPSSRKPTPLLEDASGAVWVGTSEHGLFRYNGSVFQPVPISHQDILSLLQDNEKNIWAGTDGGGLNRVSPGVVQLEGVEKGLPVEAVQSICEDANGAIWATAQNGLVLCRSNGVWHSVVVNPGLTNGLASCVVADTSGAVWIGTHNSTFYCWRAGKITNWHLRDGLAGHITHALLAGKSGEIWLGEENPEAIQRFQDGKFYSCHLPPDLRVIRAMAEDNDGNIWIGTSAGVLLRITGGQVVDETALTTDAPMSIRCLYVTPDGALWIGYAGWGVGRLKDGHFGRISVEQGLYDYSISQIVADGHGWIWFGADHGIFKARQSELEAAAGDLAAHVQCVRYGRDEQLPSLQANFGNSPGAWCSRDGRLWLPMRTALAVIAPDKISDNNTPASARLERVAVDGQTVAWYGGVLLVTNVLDLQSSKIKLHLPPGFHHLEFNFTAPEFSSPENVQFRYRLAGFDDHWIEADTQRTATYSRLAAGNYEFQVMACNGDGVWGQAAAALPFTVAPFFWQTWWFRLGALALVVVIVRYVSFRRLHLKLQTLEQQTALQKERARIAKDLHDDLGTHLTKIVLLSGLAQRDLAITEKADEHLVKISAAARRVIKSLDETVWAVNPRNNTLPHLIDYTSKFAVEFLKTAEIRCRLELPEHPPRHVVPAIARHNLFFAVKEALNNIVRHSNASEVRLRIAVTDETLEIFLEDNGCGFGQVPDNGSADGLGNMRQRVEEISGRFRLESQPGAGTRISFSCPLVNGD
ncbi:MAG TPA: two-component regulator propeller domain-containing protein, partial [Candidatus Acidoferrales bacterium]|nr:two-component regulator propeller domain-containing protein [Candidatus Acidoferrales bacterium]